MTTVLDTPDEQIADTYALEDLMVQDRCDRCSNSQAYVRVEIKGGSELLFCGHHYAAHESALVPVTLRVRDERARLLSSYRDVDATELTGLTA